MDDTRKLLKVFGVTVTDFEAEAQRLTARAAQLEGASREDLLALLKDTADACRELNARWFEIARHVHGAQEQLLSTIARAASPPAA